MENSLLSLRKSSNGRFSTSMSVYHCFHFIYGIFPGGFPRWFSPGAQRRCSGSSRGSLELCWKPTHHGFISGIYMAFTTDFLWFTWDLPWFTMDLLWIFYDLHRIYHDLLWIFYDLHGIYHDLLWIFYELHWIFYDLPKKYLETESIISPNVALCSPMYKWVM